MHLRTAGRQAMYSSQASSVKSGQEAHFALPSPSPNALISTLKSLFFFLLTWKLLALQKDAEYQDYHKMNSLALLLPSVLGFSLFALFFQYPPLPPTLRPPRISSATRYLLSYHQHVWTYSRWSPSHGRSFHDVDHSFAPTPCF